MCGVLVNQIQPPAATSSAPTARAKVLRGAIHQQTPVRLCLRKKKVAPPVLERRPVALPPGDGTTGPAAKMCLVLYA